MGKFKYFILLIVVAFVLSACGSKEFSVTFETGTEQTIEEKIVKSGTIIDILPNPERVGYSFKGWFLDEDFNTKYIDQKIKANTTLHAKWEINVFTVTFKDGEEVLKTETVEYGKDATAPTLPAKSGYDAGTWDKAFTNVTSDLVVNAVYEKLTYEVIFKVDGKDVGEKQIIEHGKEATSPANPTKDGHTFKGWDKSFAEVTSNLVINALWEIHKFKVTFVDDQDQVVEEVTVEYGKSATAPTPPTKEGYSFVEWNKDFSEIKENLTVKAVYKVATFDVKFFVDGVQVGETQIIEYGKDAIAPANPTKEGHEFKGWDKVFTNIKSNLEINATWEAETFTVTFLDEEDNIIEEVVVDYGKDATAPTPPTKEGYVFVGWNKEITNIKSDLTVKAIYEVQTFAVKFFVNGGQVGETQIIEYGKDATAPADPIMEGYEFTGWDKVFTNVKENLEIHAQLTLLTFEISYYNGDEKLVHTPDSYTIEDVIILTEYNLSGYIFLGWFLDEDFTNGPVTELDPSELKSFVLYGHFLDIDTVYSLDYELNGGSWTWTASTVADANSGIDPYSNLPELFTLDFFIYLRDNDLLTSPLVDSSIHQTTWAGFSGKNPLHNGDPYAVYNDTTTNNAQANNGYSQLFFDTATGDPTTGELIDIQGGFLGTEPYKSKYLPLIKHIALIGHYHYNTDYQNTRIWNGATGKTLLGFVLDGYFFGTQSFTRGLDQYKTLRATIPNTNAEYKYINNTLTKIDITYNFDTYTPLVDGLTINLPAPMKDGHSFVGWYDNEHFEGDIITTLKAGSQVPNKLYAKWEELNN